MFQILAAEFSRMGGTLDRAVGLGACLVPATARARQGTPCRGEGVAFKWIRIVFRRWQDRVAYDETRYLAVLAKRGSHLTSAFASAAVSV